MKRKPLLIALLLGITAGAMVFNACKKDSGPKDLTLSTLVAGDIDLNGVTSPSDVPVDPAIIATFSTNIDPATANATTIILTQDYDSSPVELLYIVSGNQITIRPVTQLGNGTLYEMNMTAGLKSTDGKALTALTRTFTTYGTFSPKGLFAYWTFEDNANDMVGNLNPSANGVVAITYADSRNAKAGKAAKFNGFSSIIEIPNADVLVNTTDFTISFWVKTNSTAIDHGHFVMGLGAYYGLQFEVQGSYAEAKFAIQYEKEDGTTVAEDMAFGADALDNTNGGWQGHDFAKSINATDMASLLKDNWLHVTYTFEGATKRGILYYNAEKMKSLDFNLWPDGDPKKTIKAMKYGGIEPDVKNELAFGFIQSRGGTMWDAEPWGGYDLPGANHFKGMLDDVKVFQKVLTPIEIDLMYQSEK